MRHAKSQSASDLLELIVIPHNSNSVFGGNGKGGEGGAENVAGMNEQLHMDCESHFLLDTPLFCVDEQERETSTVSITADVCYSFVASGGRVEGVGGGERELTRICRILWLRYLE